MDDFANARRRREEELRFIVVATVIEHLANSTNYLKDLITSEAPFNEPLDRLAQRLTAVVVDRTRHAHPLDAGETAVVVQALTSTLLRVFMGTFRGAADRDAAHGQPRKPC
jgi:hypothetical protein